MNSYIKYRNKRWRPKPQLSFSAREAKRHPYTGSKRFDRSCRNHGACGYCSEGRQHAKARQEPIAEWDLVGFEEEVLDEWNTYADPWDWGTIFEMSCDKEDELAYNERLLKRYDSYRHEWEDPSTWRREFNGLEEDHIMSIINNRLDTSEVIPCHTSVS